MRSRNSAASGPLISILPSVEASSSPTLFRTLRISRLIGRVLVLAAARIGVGAAPLADRLEDGAVLRCASRRSGCGGPGRNRLRVSDAGDRAEGERRVGRAERGEADLRDGLAGGFGEHAQAVEVRRLALVGRHAEGGVALGVLDRFVALALRQLEIGGGDVVLEIDEVLVAFIVLAGGGREPQGFERRLSGCDALRGVSALRSPGGSFAAPAGAWPSARQPSRAKRAVGGADRADRVVMPLRAEALQRRRRSGSCRHCGTTDAAPDSSRRTWR